MLSGGGRLPLALYFFNLEGQAMKLKIVLEPSDEGGFTVYVPSLPGCISEGDTKEEAMANIKEAIELYLKTVEDDLTLSTAHEIMEIAV
jgi:predicted RNase H-like HicB family nuclease